MSLQTSSLERSRRQDKNSDNKPEYKPKPSNTPKLNSFKAVTEDEIKSIINKLATKSCELDPVPTSFLKAILHALLPTITTIMNASLKHGIFTNKWKIAIICPLPKKAGLDLTLKNYRPVSNLSFLSKVLEQCILTQFNNHCNEYSLMPDYQSVYWANYSCETSLLRVINDMFWAMEHK